MGTSYSDWLVDPKPAPDSPQVPTPLLGPYGQAWLRAHGAVLDVFAAQLRHAVKARFPALALTPPDGLTALGIDRQIDRGIGETDANYATRLAGAWDTWRFAGTALGVLNALAAVGYTGVRVAQVRGRMFELDGTGNLVVTTLPSGSWQIDAVQTFWSKFKVLFVQPFRSSWLAGALSSVNHVGGGTGTITVQGAPASDERYVIIIATNGGAGVGTYIYSTDDGHTFGSTHSIPSSGFAALPGDANGTVQVNFSGSFTLGDVYGFLPTYTLPGNTSDEAARIRSIVNRWRPASATCSGYTILSSGQMFGYPANDLTAGHGRAGLIGRSTITRLDP